MGWTSSGSWGDEGWGRAAVPPAGGGAPATFVGAKAHHLATGVNNVTWASQGLSPTTGDMVIISLATGFGANVETVTGAGGVTYARLSALSTLLTPTIYCALYYRVLTGGETSVDINVAYTENSTGFAIYRGPTTATLKDGSQQAVTGDPVVAGFAPSGSTTGTVYVAIEQKDAVAPAAMTGLPHVLATRLFERPWSSIQYVSDKLSGYTSAAETLSGFNDPAAYKTAWELELT
jgi:hypothetical protein